MKKSIKNTKTNNNTNIIENVSNVIDNVINNIENVNNIELNENVNNIELNENVNNIELNENVNENNNIELKENVNENNNIELKENVNNIKQIDMNLTYNDINIETKEFSWNNVNTSIKSWGTPRENAFQEFRASLFDNKVYCNNEVFTMLQTLANKQLTQTNVFRKSDLTLIQYNNKINENKEVTNKNELFNVLELLDIKTKLYKYTYNYWLNDYKALNWIRNNNKEKVLTTTENINKNNTNLNDKFKHLFNENTKLDL